MVPRQRLAVARLTYGRAVGRVRAEPTVAAWRRLLTAAKNLRAAIQDCDVARAATLAPGSGARPVPGRPFALLAFPAPPRSRPSWWPDVIRELEWSRDLVAQARELREEARALRAEVMALRKAPRGLVARRPS